GLVGRVLAQPAQQGRARPGFQDSSHWITPREPENSHRCTWAPFNTRRRTVATLFREAGSALSGAQDKSGGEVRGFGRLGSNRVRNPYPRSSFLPWGEWSSLAIYVGLGHRSWG